LGALDCIAPTATPNNSALVMTLLV
jgi:hypothetical protein